MILAGDIGGTKTVIGLFQRSGPELHALREEVYSSQDHQSLEQILGEFLQGSTGASLQGGCFGVAGAVIDGQCQTTNLPWHLDERALARTLGAPVKLLNDLEAAAYGMLFQRPEELHVLNPGAKPGRKGTVAVIAAGTGLGEAFLFWDGRHYQPIASEGGHADFAPRTDQEIDLYRYLRFRYPEHVSYERVLSGQGFHHVYTFLRESSHAPEPLWLTEKLQSGDPNVTITEVGLAGGDPVCVAALDLFCSIYGSEAGNLALKCVATGGVFVAGGIAPKILPALEKGNFVTAFLNKGRFTEFMKGIEINVALNPRAPLLGAAYFALRL